MINERHIVDSLNSIRDILCYYADATNYTTYIEELNKIIDELESEKQVVTDPNKLDNISKLEQRAQLYLKKTKILQSNFENQENNEK